MARSLEQLERNVSASFGYVKKDLLMLNDSISDLHDKIQHLSLNHAALMEKIQSLENFLTKDEKKTNKVAKKTSKKKAKVSNSKKKPVKKVVKETITYE